MTTLIPFVTFKPEAAIIARLLAGYTNLEIGLLHCVQMATGNFDKSLKAMFRVRGETNRILKCQELGEPIYNGLKLGAPFRDAIGSMRHCLKIRNQYSHCAWWDDNSGQLAFANLEDIARLNIVVPELGLLPASYVNEGLLAEQEAFFGYVDKLLLWVNLEGRYRAGKLSNRFYPKPLRMKRPPLRLP